MRKGKRKSCMRQVKSGRLSGKRIALLIATGLMLAFIFGQSLLPPRVSAEESGWLTEKILDPLMQQFGFSPITHHAVRKIAHVAEFAILSVLLVFCFRGQIIKAVGAGFTAAFLDESIQLLSGRDAMIADVWIDLIGIAAGLLLGCLLFFAIIRRKKERNSDQDTQTDAP